MLLHTRQQYTRGYCNHCSSLPPASCGAPRSDLARELQKQKGLQALAARRWRARRRSGTRTIMNFEGAPVCRIVACGGLASAFFLPASAKARLALDLGAVLARGEWLRLISHHWVFDGLGEAALGSIALFRFRRRAIPGQSKILRGLY